MFHRRDLFLMSVSILVASSSNIGGRQAQEDRLVVVEDLNEYIPAERRFEHEPPRSLFAVFDGHCGGACSEFLAKTFPVELARNPLLISDPKRAMLEVWDALEEKFYGICVQTAIKALKKRTRNGGTTGKGEPAKKRVGFASASFPMDGSTATVLLRVGNKIFIANCGDSAGILIKKTGDVEIITKDHGTLNREESKRVHRSGGYYRQQVLKSSKSRPFCCFSTEALVGKPRVYPGGLLVTRSFGDFSAKVAGLGGKPGVILADCEEVVEMTVEEDWAEVLIASDGIWDVLPPHNMPQMLARLGSNGRGRRLKDRFISSSYSGNRKGKRLGKTWEFPRWTDEDRRLEQAKMNSTCTKLVQACVKDRFWTDNRAVADNASVIVLQFFQSASDMSIDSSGASIDSSGAKML